MNNMFSGCINLIYLNLENFTCEKVTEMIDIFKDLNKECKIIVKDKMLLNKFK